MTTTKTKRYYAIAHDQRFDIDLASYYSFDSPADRNRWVRYQQQYGSRYAIYKPTLGSETTKYRKDIKHIAHEDLGFYIN